MVWIDYAILLVIVVSVVISWLRGFVREAMSLAGWIVSFWVALRFSGGFATFLQGMIPDTTLRLIVAFFAMFILTLLMFSVANFFASKLVERTGLTSADRAIGLVFGLVRGVLIVAALVMVAGLTQLPQAPAWKDSVLIVYFQGFAIWLKDYLPNDVAQHFVF
jgi:membrane protein required for colicin V production